MNITTVNRLACLGLAALLASGCIIKTGDSDADGSGGRGATTGTGGGTGGTGGEGGGGGESYRETCGAQDDNDTSEKAVPLASSATLCVSDGDIDWLAVSVPDDGKGHVLELALDQEPEARISFTAVAAADDSEIGSVVLEKGTKRTVFLTVGSGTTTYLKVEPYFGAGLLTIALTRTAEADAQEPNNERSQAAAIAPNTDVTGQFMVPYVAQDNATPDDWFKVELAAGQASVELTQLPENVRFNVVVYDAAGQEVATEVAPNAGALVSLPFEVQAAGIYHIGLQNYFSGEFDPMITTGAPKHLTATYTLRVAQ